MSTAGALYLRYLVARVTAPQNKPSAADRLATLDLGIKVMALLVGADGRVDDMEVEKLLAMSDAAAGTNTNSDSMRRAIDAVNTNPDSVWRDLNAARHLPSSRREDILAAASAAATADGKIHPEETALLDRIGQALGLSAERITALIQVDGTVSEAPVTPAPPRLMTLLFNSRGGQALKQILDRFHHEESGLTAAQRRLATDLTVKAMVLMALVDGNVEEAELRLTGEIYATLGGSRLGVRLLSCAVSEVNQEKLRTLQAFDQAASLGDETREDILRAAFRVAQVDGHVDRSEQALIREIAARMSFDPQQAMKIAQC